jgi:predicted nuclease with TOPRIM domain
MAANSPSDVSPSHWAYQAVKVMIDKGYLQLYQDKSFQGEKPVDRYTLAVVISKILNEIAVGRVGSTKEDVELLRKLTNEYWNELVEMSIKESQSSKRMERLSKQDQIFKEDLTQTMVMVQKLTAEQILLQKEVQQILDEIQTLSMRVKQLEEENIRLKDDMARLQAQYDETKHKQNLYIFAAIILGLAGAAK